MAQNKPRTVSTFRAPTEYELALERARRQKALAEALAQQEYVPMEGTAAPIPRAAPLVKALQGYLTARAGRKAEEAEAEARGMETRAGEQIAGRVFGGAPVRDVDTTPDESGLAEVAIQSQYRQSPQDALRMASTPQGAAALRGNPALAAALEQSMKAPEAEYGTTPQYDAQGKAYVINKAGQIRYLDGITRPDGEAPTSFREFKLSQTTPGFKEFIESRTPKTTVDVRYGAPVAGVDAQGNPVFFQPNPTGGPPSIISGVAPKPEAMGAGEANAALFADRAARAEPIFNQLPPPSLSATAKGNLGAVGNVLLTPENRQFFQAERNFITAVLRKESGANIPENEYNDARRVYIPQAGDDDRTLEMKRQARQDAIAGIARGAGPTYKVPSMSKNDEIVDLPPRRR